MVQIVRIDGDILTITPENAAGLALRCIGRSEGCKSSANAEEWAYKAVLCLEAVQHPKMDALQFAKGRNKWPDTAEMRAVLTDI